MSLMFRAERFSPAYLSLPIGSDVNRLPYNLKLIHLSSNKDATSRMFKIEAQISHKKANSQKLQLPQSYQPMGLRGYGYFNRKS